MGRIVWAFGLFMLGLYMQANGEAAAAVGVGDLSACEAEYVSILEDVSRFPTPASRLAHWESLKSRCGGDRQYEVRRGALYVKAGDYGGGERILMAALKATPEYRKHILYSFFESKFLNGRINEAKAKALALVREYPDWGGGYAALGRVALVSDQFQEVIRLMEKANSLYEKGGYSQPDAGNYQRLAIAYYNVGRYEDSVRAMQTALRSNPQGLAHTTSVCATAASLIKLAQPLVAKDLLVKHLRLSPQSRSDAFCGRVIAYFGDI